MAKKTESKRVCSMCGSHESETNPLITDFDGNNLCRDCVYMSRQIISELCHKFDEIDAEDVKKAKGAEKVSSKEELHYLVDSEEAPAPKPANPTESLKVPRPAEIKEFLDQYVIGQDNAKRSLAVAVHNHYKRVKYEDARQRSGKKNGSDVELEKSNILLVGPTGSGKTLLARTLAKMLDVPFAIADATTLTEAGYVGEDVENILLNLLQAADMNLERAERGIVFVDEIDKIGRKTENVSITRDVSGEGVQQALLKIVEGTVAHIPPAGGRKHPQQQYIEMQTKNILFICGGAFIGLDKIITQRASDHHLGFGAAEEKSIVAPGRVQPEDLMRFGLIPEFVGRLPVVTMLDELDEESLVRILTEPKNCMVKQYAKLLEMEDISLEFETKALRTMAAESLARKTGARGLRAIMEELMLDIMYSPEKFAERGGKLRITDEMVKAQLRKPGSMADMLGKRKSKSE